MKKLIAMILALTLVFGMTGCVSAEEKEIIASLTEKINLFSNVGLDHAADVQAAQDIYDSLSSAAQKRVKNYDLLENAQIQLAEIVSKMIDDIGTVTLDSEALIDQAQSAYDVLPLKAQGLVENYPKLNDASAAYIAVFTSEMEAVTSAVEQINAAMDKYDAVTICQLLDKYLPIAQKLVTSKLFVSESNPAELLEGIQDVMVTACYPNTRIISLKNYMKLIKRSSGVTSADETTVNVDKDTKMEYTTYFCNSVTDMSNAFITYTDYLKQYFKLDKVTSDGSSATYMFLDELGRKFYVEWAYYNLGYYGTVCAIYVGFAPEIGFASAVKG